MSAAPKRRWRLGSTLADPRSHGRRICVRRTECRCAIDRSLVSDRSDLESSSSRLTTQVSAPKALKSCDTTSRLDTLAVPLPGMHLLDPRWLLAGGRGEPSKSCL